MIAWADSSTEFVTITDALLQYSKNIEDSIVKKRGFAGYCLVCERICCMKVSSGEGPGDWVNLLEGMVCVCGINGRARLILLVLDEILRTHSFPSAVVLERLTPLYPLLQIRFPNLMGSEYFADVPSGSTVWRHGKLIRSESMMDLSIATESVDLIMHFDILEHIPDWHKGLQECFRVLKPEGVMLFSFPFYHALDRNIVRAEIKNNAIRNILPPVYHGNPVSPHGSLVFIHPSWEVHEYLSFLGFSSVKLAFCYDPLQGIFSNGCPFPDGHMWPAVFTATK